jgi:hypothetical protein
MITISYGTRRLDVAMFLATTAAGTIGRTLAEPLAAPGVHVGHPARDECEQIIRCASTFADVSGANRAAAAEN